MNRLLHRRSGVHFTRRLHTEWERRQFSLVCFVSITFFLFTYSTFAFSSSHNPEQDTLHHLLRIAQSSKNWFERQNAIRELANTPLIHEILKVDDWRTRAEAVRYITDAETLEEVARYDPDPYVRLEAVRKLQDPKTLYHIALHDPVEFLQKEAIERLNEQHFLEKIILNHPEEEFRAQALINIQDNADRLKFLKKASLMHKASIRAVLGTFTQEELKTIVLGDFPEIIQIEAFLGINDLSFLSNIVLQSNIPLNIRKAAISSIDDYSLLYNLFLKLNEDSLKIECLAHITRDDLLVQILKTTTQPRFIIPILKNLHEEKTLQYYATTHPDAQVRKTATQKLTDDALLFSILENEKDSQVKIEAVRRIRDTQKLLSFLKNEKNPALRAVILERIPFQESILKKYALEDPSPQVRYSALSRVNDQETLKQGVLTDPVLENQLVALHKITQEPILKDIYLSSRNWLIRKKSVEKIHDARFLFKQFQKERIKNVRKEILANIPAKTLLQFVQMNERIPHIEEIAHRLKNTRYFPAFLQSLKNIDDQIVVLPYISRIEDLVPFLQSPNETIRELAGHRYCALRNLKPTDGLLELIYLFHDPIIWKKAGPLTFHIVQRFEEIRYRIESQTYPPLRVYAYQEYLNFSVVLKDGTYLFSEEFKGPEPPRSELFDDILPGDDSIRRVVYSAQPDFLHITEGLIQKLDLTGVSDQSNNPFLNHVLSMYRRQP